MAKLYGTADSTLVSAAFKEGMSNVPLDLSGVYSKREQNFKDFTKTITEVFDNIYADDKKTWDLLADNAQETLDIMESGGNNSEYMMNLNQDIVEGYKTRLKAIPDGKKGDRERSKLRAEMNKYKSVMASSDDMFMAMVNNAANSSLMDTLGDNRKKLFDEILKDYNNGTSNTKPKYVDGELVYTLPGVAGKDGKEVTMSMRDISKGMTAHDPAYLNTTQKALTDFQALGMKSKGNITPEMLVRFNRGLSKSMTNMDQIRMVSKEKFGNMAHSFEEVLTGQSKDPSLLADIFTSLENLGGIDLNDDGLVNEGDTKLLEQAKRTGGTYYNSAGNAVTLIDALQKDKTKYRDLLSGYLTETAAKDFYGYGVDQRKKVGGGGGGGQAFGVPTKGLRLGPMINGQYQQKESQRQVVDYITRLKSGQEIQYQGNEYTFRDGNWIENYGFDDIEAKTIGNADDMRRDVFQTTDKSFMNLETEFEERIDHSTGKVATNIMIKNNTKKKYGTFKAGTQTISLEAIKSSLQDFNPDLISYQDLIKFQDKIKNANQEDRYKLTQQINKSSGTNIGVGKLDEMIEDLVSSTDPLNNN